MYILTENNPKCKTIVITRSELRSFTSTTSATYHSLLDFIPVQALFPPFIKDWAHVPKTERNAALSCAPRANLIRTSRKDHNFAGTITAWRCSRLSTCTTTGGTELPRATRPPSAWRTTSVCRARHRGTSVPTTATRASRSTAPIFTSECFGKWGIVWGYECTFGCRCRWKSDLSTLS